RGASRAGPAAPRVRFHRLAEEEPATLMSGDSSREEFAPVRPSGPTRREAWSPPSDARALEIESGAMRSERRTAVLLLLAVFAVPPSMTAAAPRPAPADRRLEALKREAAADVDRMQGFTQRMVDTLFSFGELGFQEVETSRHLV